MSLFPDPPDFDGETYSPDEDAERLSRQLDAVRSLMLDGEWRTLAEISAATGAPEASASSRLRDLRKSRFGSYRVESKRQQRGRWVYRVVVVTDAMKH